MNDIKTKLMTKYNSSLNHLHNVGDEYVNNSKNNEKAQNDLFKVYRGYKIFTNILAVFILLLSFTLVIITHHPAWVAIMPLAIVFPKTIHWALTNVLNIDELAYTNWLKKSKQK